MLCFRRHRPGPAVYPGDPGIHAICNLGCAGRSRKTGAPISDLQAADFEVLEDGKPQAVSYFNHDQLPLSVVLLFDLTDTVQPILKPLALAAHGVLDHLKANDEVSVMVFSSHTTLLQDFTTDRGLASAAVERASAMKTAQGTFIHEDMYEAIDQALTSKAPESRRVMVWLTDGTANFEYSRTKKLLAKKRRRNCTANRRRRRS